MVKNWIMKLFSKTFLSDYLGGAVRTLLAALGGYLTAKNIASQETADAFINSAFDMIMGLIPLALAWVTSIANKKTG